MATQVFRVTLNNKPPPLAKQFDAESGTYRARKTHNKSRRGCRACKDRRKKCDERRPKCSACEKRDCDCEYKELKQAKQNRKASLSSTASTLVENTWPGPRAPGILVHEGKFTENDLFLVNHFTRFMTEASNYPERMEGQMASIYSGKAVALALEYRFLMHAMIALSACHLQHLETDARQYRLAEAFHCQVASRGLSEAVVSIRNVQDADSILTTAMILNCLTFCAAEYRDDLTEPQWGWLRFQIGLTDLLIRTNPYHPESVWMFLFQATNDFRIMEAATNDLSERLAAFCGVDLSVPEEEGEIIYAEPLRWLSPIISRPATPRYMLLYTRFIGSITRDFVELMEQRDVKALVVFAHWLALMCSIDQWWCRRRTRRECWKICDFLIKELRGRDLELLAFPAKACGYL